MPDRRGLLVLGLGNVLCGDDGLGIAAVRHLVHNYAWPANAEVLDGGTLGLALLPYLEDAEDAILVDAVRTGDPAGTFVRLLGEDVPPAVMERLSPHQIGVADLLAGASLLERTPRRLALLGLVPETIELGLSRSPSVEAGIPALVECVVAQARDWGYRFAHARAA